MESSVPPCFRLPALLSSFALAAAFVLPSGALAQAAAATRLDDVLARGVLRVGTTGDYKPFSYRAGATGAFIGLDITLAADLAKSMGVTLQVVPTTWGTMMGDLADDRFDLAMGGVSVSLERRK